MFATAFLDFSRKHDPYWLKIGVSECISHKRFGTYAVYDWLKLDVSECGLICPMIGSILILSDCAAKTKKAGNWTIMF
jgi:hypothetical protein